MKTSLHDPRIIEAYLRGRLPRRLVAQFVRRLRVDPALRKELYFQRLTYRLVRLYHRRRITDRLMEVHTRLFADPNRRSFQQSVYRCFEAGV